MIYVYTGEGKGKTSASLGALLRTIALNKKILLIQFMKTPQMLSNEIITIKKYFPDLVEVYQFGAGFYKKGEEPTQHIQKTKQGIEMFKEKINEDFSLYILDELNIVLHLGFIKFEEIKDTLLIFKKNLQKHIIITGRYAPNELVELADLVTEMKEIKHYYKDGIPAIKGVDF